jgi:uncharacterized integral membrane protein
MKFKTILLLLLVTLIVWFTLQNYEVTTVNFLFWEITVSRIIVILGSFIIGFLFGFLLNISSKSKKTHKETEQQNQ